MILFANLHSVVLTAMLYRYVGIIYVAKYVVQCGPFSWLVYLLRVMQSYNAIALYQILVRRHLGPRMKAHL